MFIKKIFTLHSLSIDAALIAVTWQLFFAKKYGVNLGIGPPLVLGISIFLGYLGDRWLDVQKMQISAIQTKRHRLIANHKTVWMWIFIVLFVADLTVALTLLTSQQLILGLMLFMGCVLYTQKTYVGIKGSIFPKELKNSLLFAVGVFLFLIGDIHDFGKEMLLHFSLFFLICLADVGLVAHWEQNTDIAQNVPSIATRWPNSYNFFRYLGPSVAILAFATLGDIKLSVAFAVPGLGFWALDYSKAYTDTEERQAFADFLLFSPWLIW